MTYVVVAFLAFVAGMVAEREYIAYRDRHWR